MLNNSETLATSAIILIAVAILVWGFNRARPYGKIGILSWLQSVVLMAPWLLFSVYLPPESILTWWEFYCCC